MSIVEALIEQVAAEIEDLEQPGRVIALDLIIGRISGVHVESLRFAFELLSPGTIAEGADLRIQEPRPRLKCQACGTSQDVEQLTLDCPRCSSADVSIHGGQELLLQTIELAGEST